MKQAPFRWEMLSLLFTIFTVLATAIWNANLRVARLEWMDTERTQKNMELMASDVKSLRQEMNNERQKASEERTQMLLDLGRISDALGVRMEKRVP